jgi:hypothetical protein
MIRGTENYGSAFPFSNQPVFFERNRVSRVYRGGLLFHDFFGDPAEDGSSPEEWVASTVRAFSKEPKSELEGISIVKGTGTPFSALMEKHREALVGERGGFVASACKYFCLSGVLRDLQGECIDVSEWPYCGQRGFIKVCDKIGELSPFLSPRRGKRAGRWHHRPRIARQEVSAPRALAE